MKKKETIKGSDVGTESALELEGRLEDTSGKDTSVESCNNTEEVEDSALELKDGMKETSEGEAASVKIRKRQAMLEEEEERPHYNPHQGEYSRVAYILCFCTQFHK